MQILKENEEGFGILLEADAGVLSPTISQKLVEGTHISKIDLTQPIIYYATLQKYGVENKNGRIYPEHILKREVERYKEIIRMNSSFHEMDHPEESIISLKGGSPYRILELFWKGNVLIGKLEVLVSEGYRRSGIISCNGDLLAHYLNYGMTVGISSRGVGSLKKVQGKNIVQDDFELVCWDAVSSPSTPGSFLYKDLEDFSTYDHLDPIKPEPNDNKTTQSEFMNKLSYFLGKN